MAASADPPLTQELVFKDKPLLYWLPALAPERSASTQPKQAEAQEAIHAMGPDAIPAILRYRRGNRAERLDVIRRACLILEPDADVKLAEALKDPDADIRETALEVLPDSAIPLGLDDLLKAVADPVRPVRNAAIQALVRLLPEREETIAALIEALHDPNLEPDNRRNPFSRADAALALGRIGSKAKAALPELTAMLGDSSDDSREAAATALWKIDHDPQAIPVLVERLENAPDYQTCLRVMKFLGDIGGPAKLAVPVLRKKIEEPGLTFLPPGVDFPKIALETLAKIDAAAAEQARKKIKP